jgi:hypothetical protein
MRHAALVLIVLVLPGSALAELEFLTVREIFDAVDFLAAHPEAPVNFTTVSPFGPDPSETRMPEILANVAKTILRCYHGSARYRDADVAGAPWDQAAQYGGEVSALIRIRYSQSVSDDIYEMRVGLVSRQEQLRTAVVSDNLPAGRNANCHLEQWTTLKPH